jgi:hypothetical protein
MEFTEDRSIDRLRIQGFTTWAIFADGPAAALDCAESFFILRQNQKIFREMELPLVDFRFIYLSKHGDCPSLDKGGRSDGRQRGASSKEARAKCIKKAQ